MTPFTQTNLTPGNCWQTVVACLLDVNPDTLPHQELYDWVKKPDLNNSSTWEYGPSYYTALNAYLKKHHGLAYSEIQAFNMYVLEYKAPGYHFLTGYTVRSPHNGNKRHVVVARYGEIIHDPHPDRTCLTEVLGVGFLIPYPKVWEKQNSIACECPACSIKP